MKMFFKVILLVLVLLAISFGITKIVLMPQDVEFFGSYGFTKPILIAYGITQLIGGIMLAVPISRIIGAIIVAATFINSAVVLVIAGKYAVTFITLICVLLLGFIIKRSLKLAAPGTNETQE
jgi:uncharacterized membrane protein YphA (DoxX/SURF4 family)